MALHAPMAESQVFQFETRRPGQKSWDLSGIETRLREEGLRLPASKPSNEDPAGNWGLFNVGWELSVRPVLSQFAVGDPVYLWAILRNVSGTNSELIITIADLNWEVTVMTADGRVLEPSYAWAFKQEFDRDMKARAIRASKQIVAGWEQYPVRANHQCLLLLRLSADYDLTTPGTYSVRLSRRFYEFGRTDYQQVTSGTATFRIVDKPGTATTNTNNGSANVAAQPLGQASKTVGSITGNTIHATATPNDVIPNDRSSSPRRNLLWSGALAGLILFGVLGLWLLRRGKA
jgi:hypothetical protein